MKHWQLNHQKQLANSDLDFISGLSLVNQVKHPYPPLKRSMFDIHAQREILHF